MPDPRPDLTALAAAVRSIERGEHEAAPAPRGDAEAARRRRREALAAEAQASPAGLEGAESAEGAAPAAAGEDEPSTAGSPADAGGAGEPGGSSGSAPEGGTDAAGQAAGEGAGQPGRGRDGGAGESGARAGQASEGGTDAAGQEPEGAGQPGRGPDGGAGAVSPPLGRGQAIAAPREVRVDPGVLEAVARVLQQGGAPGELAGQVVRVLGEAAEGALRGDPWLLLGLAAVRVEQADGFARGLLGEDCGPGDPRRARALVARVLEDAALRGHTALPSDDVRAALGQFGLPDPEAAVAAAVGEGQLLVFREGDDEGDDEGGDEEPQGPLLLALDRYAMAEDSLADGFFRLLRSFADAAPTEEWAQPAGASPSTAELLGAAAGSGLVVHCGGEAARAEPTALVAAARAAGLRAYAAAYTENGRRRLADALGEPEAAVTVHGLLGAEQGPGLTADGTLDLDLLAVLDAPQLTVEEAATLVECVPDGARLVLSGDPNALWSAGPGRVFADLVASRACPRVVSRTPDPGPIGELVSCVGVGELTAVDAPGKEVVVVPVRDPGEALHRTVQLVADSVPRAFGTSGPDVQVVTAGHGGPVGTRALNAALKERLNPGPGRFAGFDPGDRVVYVPAPGRTLPGTVAGADPAGLRLDCEAGPVLVPRDDVAGTVRHGWAVTGHQAAGMRWPAAVVVVPGDAGPLLTRSWAYTAFGRGERHLSVVQGAEGRLAQAVAGPPAAERTTRLAAALRELTAEG